MKKNELKKISDEELVGLVIKDKNFFEEIINRYQKKILRYLFYLVGNKEDAEDIAQEVFIKVYVNLLGFDKNLKFSSWIFRIAHNEALNFLKKRKINLQLYEKTYPIQREDEEDLDEKELKKKIHACLDKLPVLYREIIDLFYFEKMKYEQISDALKIPPGTVAVRLSRAKKILKKICQNQKV